MSVCYLSIILSLDRKKVIFLWLFSTRKSSCASLINRAKYIAELLPFEWLQLRDNSFHRQFISMLPPHLKLWIHWWMLNLCDFSYMLITSCVILAQENILTYIPSSPALENPVVCLSGSLTFATLRTLLSFIFLTLHLGYQTFFGWKISLKCVHKLFSLSFCLEGLQLFRSNLTTVFLGRGAKISRSGSEDNILNDSGKEKNFQPFQPNFKPSWTLVQDYLVFGVIYQYICMDGGWMDGSEKSFIFQFEINFWMENSKIYGNFVYVEQDCCDSLAFFWFGF